MLRMDDKTIPHALRVMMDQLFANNSLKSWGVFPNQYGQVCLNIRFDICEVGQSSKPVTTSAFRRVSDKQLARNATRSMYNKKRKLNPSTPETKDTHISPPSPKSHTTPELPRNCDISESPNVGFIDSPILAVKDFKVDDKMTKEYESAEIANESFDLHSISEETCSPNIEITPLTSFVSHLSPPNLKIDGASQVEYDTQDTSTQVDRSWFQSNQINQCSVKLKTKSIQTKLEKSINESVQASPEPTVHEDSCQTHVSALKPDMMEIAANVKYPNTTEPEHSILCPCCDRAMTTDHECEPEIDQKDNIVTSNASTQNQSITNCTQPTPDPPVRNQSSPNLQPNQNFDATLEHLAAYMTSQHNLMIKKLFPRSPPT